MSPHIYCPVFNEINVLLVLATRTKDCLFCQNESLPCCLLELCDGCKKQISQLNKRNSIYEVGTADLSLTQEVI